MEREQRVSVCFHALPYVAKSVKRCVWVIENRDIWRKGVRERISYRGWYIGRRVRETGRRHETHSHCTSFQPSFATTLRPFFLLLFAFSFSFSSLFAVNANSLPLLSQGSRTLCRIAIACQYHSGPWILEREWKFPSLFSFPRFSSRSTVFTPKIVCIPS